MDDSRIDAALRSLAGQIPKAPRSLTENMVRTVNALSETRKQQMSMSAAESGKTKQVLPEKAVRRNSVEHRKKHL